MKRIVREKVSTIFSRRLTEKFVYIFSFKQPYAHSNYWKSLIWSICVRHNAGIKLRNRQCQFGKLCNHIWTRTKPVNTSQPTQLDISPIFHTLITHSLKNHSHIFYPTFRFFANSHCHQKSWNDAALAKLRTRVRSNSVVAKDTVVLLVVVVLPV